MNKNSINNTLTRAPVNKLAAMVTNQSGCDETLNSLLIRRQALLGEIRKVEAALAGRGRSAGQRRTLQTLRARLGREAQAIASQLGRLGVGKITRKSGVYSFEQAFVCAAREMLTKAAYDALAARAKEYLQSPLDTSFWPTREGETP